MACFVLAIEEKYCLKGKTYEVEERLSGNGAEPML